MQTFIVTSDYDQSARYLDKRRLFKQVLEGYQILNCLLNGTGWNHHPIVRGWRENEGSLVDYCLQTAQVAVERGINIENLVNKINDLADRHGLIGRFDKPDWIFNDKILSSHRSRLLLKGEIDAVCEDIRKQNGLRGINKWLKENGYADKNLLRLKDLDRLNDYCYNFMVYRNTKNWYRQFNWSESPGDEYVWPSN